ncbi:cytoplasmic RNA-binding protein [Dinochytrium kinnereticum]|nr:cytoplasmic RNA-binding protein [Dinochytrium kinnereticum]
MADEETLLAHEEDDQFREGGEEDVDQELLAMKARVQQMEEEAAKLRAMQEQVEKEMNAASPAVDQCKRFFSAYLTVQAIQQKAEIDSRSVYVGNVDYSSTPEEIQAHFQSCGTINRVTILCDKWTGHPKGFAYVEFADSSLVSNALALNDSLFKGRLIKVTAKRTNVPTFMRGGARGGRGGGRSFRGGGGFARGGFDRGGYGRGRPPYRARRGYFSPY